MPRVAVVSCGGTIASEPGADGAKPEKSGAELVERVPDLASHATVTAMDAGSTPGFDADFASVIAARDAIRDAVDGGADGVVVTHGTDTLADVAYALDFLTDVSVPVVVTGAQRRFDEPGSDAPSNLLTAVRAAADPAFGGCVTVCFDDEVHRARDVVKTHTNALDTFQSPGKGPVATFTRGGVRHHRPAAGETPTFATLDADALAAVRVPVCHSGVGVDAADFERLAADADGVVVEGTGLGNVTAALGSAVADVAAEVPVVVASRCHAGPTEPVYGTAGGAVTLDRAGAHFAGDLPAAKARVKLVVALASGADPDALFE